ncbi:hypothetical protein [Rubrivirga sp.]|uniref:hypothetical protein n=1 Tax=Rubrivirga sp. TaxID=1885344 RepID=UPI003B5254C9
MSRHLAFALVLLLSGCAQIEQSARDALDDARPTTYETSQGESVRFALGAVAFGDRVARFAPTVSLAPAYSDPSQAVGAPDYGTDRCRSGDECYLTLTSGGTVVVEFTNNTLFDGPGDDIAIFEIGPDIEATTVEISVDGRDYLPLGRVEGASALLDIAGRGMPGAQYRFVRLTDDPGQGDSGGSTPGADLDAVGAIHAERR